MTKISYDEYFDRVYGGWYGKCIGGAVGAFFEGQKKLVKVDRFEDVIREDLANDDLDLQVMWLEVVEKKGPALTSRDLADAWMNQCWYPFCEYGVFLKNYMRGIRPPYSGNFNNSFYKESMGCPIRSEIWGFVFPGTPEKAMEYARMDGVLDHTDNAVLAEEFFAAMESMLFFEDNLLKLLEFGLQNILSESRIYACVRMVINEYTNENNEWKDVRSKIIAKYGHPDFTNAVQNIGFTVLSLLYGKGNMRQTIEIALQCGYDTDCTCATAAAILGGIQGYSKIDSNLIGLVQDKYVVGIDVKRRSDSIKDLAEDTCRVGVSLSRYGICNVEIEEVPADIKILEWPTKERKQELEVFYCNDPVIGLNDTAEFSISIENKSDAAFAGRLEFSNIPVGWSVQSEKFNVSLAQGEITILQNAVKTGKKVVEINQTNIMEAILIDDRNSEIYRLPYGIAGAGVWGAFGPFFEQLQVEELEGMPKTHMILPLAPIESMMNNVAFLDKEYVDEKALVAGKLSVPKVVNTYEDRFDIGNSYGIAGPCCWYLTQEILCPDERDSWMVIGNNNPFKVWLNGDIIIEKDETRYWTPFNHSRIVKLKKGTNRLIIKLVRNTEKIDFSISFKIFTKGLHMNNSKWCTDLAFRV